MKAGETTRFCETKSAACARFQVGDQVQWHKTGKWGKGQGEVVGIIFAGESLRSAFWTLTFETYIKDVADYHRLLVKTVDGIRLPDPCSVYLYEPAGRAM